MSMTVESAVIPSHVPPHLAFNVEPMAGNTDEAIRIDPYKAWSQLKDLPPVFWSSHPKRTGWMAVGADAIRDLMQDTEHFTNDDHKMIRRGGDYSGLKQLVPLGMDPPEHGKYRALLGPIFSPKAIDDVEKSLSGLSAELIDKFADKGECEFMSAYARPFPVLVFMKMMGLPLDEREQFLEWEHQFFQGDTEAIRTQATNNIYAYMRGLLDEKRKKPVDDIMSKLVHAKIDGKPIDPEKLDGACMLLYLAGLDTVAAGLGHTFRYLAEHPEMQSRLRANPDLIPEAVEESLRYHTWVVTGRACIKEIDFHGARILPGEWVAVILHGASNDPRENAQPREFIVPREANRNFAFGAGVHRCAGSHLARREMRIGVRMMLERTNQIAIKPGATLRYDGGQVCLGALPLQWAVAA